MHDDFDGKGKWKTGPEEWASNPEHLLEQKVFLDIVKNAFRIYPNDRPVL
jgi:hypothetical protein